MGLFGDILGGAAAVTGGLAGTVAGIPGMIAGSKGASGLVNGITGNNKNPNDPLSYLQNRPEYPTYKDPGAYTPTNGTQVSYADQLNTQGLDKLRGLATSDGESPWATMQRSELSRQQGLGADQLRANAGQGLAQATGNLASHGGLTGGAAERMAGGSNLAMQENLQKLGGQGAQLGSQIGIADNQNKMDLLKSLPGMEVASMAPRISQDQFNAGLDQSNAQNKNQYGLQSAAGQNQFNQSNYTADTNAWGQMANAQATAANRPKGFWSNLLDFG